MAVENLKAYIREVAEKERGRLAAGASWGIAFQASRKASAFDAKVGPVAGGSSDTRRCPGAKLLPITNGWS
eukprot:14856126-Alexandrium_andersonii.AAC.1